MKKITRNTLKLAVALMTVVGLLGVGNVFAASLPASACTSSGGVATCDLYAMTGTATLYGSTTVPIWGYAATSAGPAGLPGPALIVNQGDTVTVNLHNVNLPEGTSLNIQGQSMIPDLSDGVVAGASKSYTFTASRPGTFLYEAGLGLGKQHQVAMGMYGALIVQSSTLGTAYGTSTTAYDEETAIVLSEVDPTLNASASPATFDMRNYTPKYFLINGAAYTSGFTGDIPVTAGHNVLLRYINAGLQAHAMSTLGLSQKVVATDGFDYGHPYTMVAETIATGETLDTIVSIPSTAPAGTKYALYDANLLLRNSAVTGLGGMLTFLSISGSGGGSNLPVTSNVAVTPSKTNGTSSVALTATISNSPDGAEYFVDSVGVDGTGCSISGSFTDVNVTINVSGATAPCVDLTTLPSGNHTFYVHGHNANGWGVVSSAVLNLDKAGPTTSALVLSPNPTNGTVDVALTASASDVSSGNSNIIAAEYTIDGGTAVSMTVNQASSTAGLSATISAATVNALSQGSHNIAVRSEDELGNWGGFTTTPLTVDKTAPDTSNVSASPNPNNGSMPFNTSTPAVRVTASFSDVVTGNSNIAAAEGFIDTTAANGTGFAFIATDGTFNSPAETGYGDIPLAVVGSLSDGPHTIYVHAKDAAGNWNSTFATTVLTIDKTAPTITSVTLTPNTIAFGAVSVTLNVTATDGAGLGLNGGRYWIDGTGNPPANATAFSGTSATIDTSALTAGTHTVYVQMQDMLGNWSTASTATLYVVQAIGDAYSITADTSATQTSDVNTASGLLANDQPLGVAGRTTVIASAPVRTSGNGAGTITISCPASLGTAATPSISGNTVCTNGTFRVTLNGVGNNNNQRRSSKRGTFQFTYTLTLNGVTSTTTVTITVQ